MRHRAQSGFTLMELMVVIVIVAILAAVAVPLYINYVKDAKRTEAKGAIAALISAAQVYYQKQTPTLTYVGMDDAAKPDHINIAEIVSESSRNWDYSFVAASPTTTGFTVTAHGKADANGLDVTCVYDRTKSAVWTDTPPAP